MVIFTGTQMQINTNTGMRIIGIAMTSEVTIAMTGMGISTSIISSEMRTEMVVMEALIQTLTQTVM